MNIKHLLDIIAHGEGLHTEFKEAGNHLPDNLFDTVCAFLNTDGGMIFLGVSDNGSIVGVDPEAVSQIKIDIANLSNNPQKIDLPYLLFPYEIEIDGKSIIVIQVPLSSQIHKHKNEIFLRSEDGDYRIQGTHQLAGLINRKLGIFTEQRSIRFAGIDDLRPDIFDRARRLMRSYNSQHPWADLTNEELLKIAGFYTTDTETGKQTLSLAGLLMFGNDIAIQQAVPAYKFDCLLRRENEDRYDDRLTIRTNLIDAYDQMMGFVGKHLNDPFYLEGDMRISLRDKIFREAVSNIVSHREYTSAAPARLLIYKNRVILDNPTVQQHFDEITLENLRPFSKNPTICKFMIQLGRFDELGSGVRNINKYLPLYANDAKPVFKETIHGFKLTIPLKKENKADDNAETNGQFDPEPGLRPESRPELRPKSQPESKIESPLAIKIIKLLSKRETGKAQLASELGHKTISGELKKQIKRLLEMEFIEMTIPEKPNSRLQKYRLTDQGKDYWEREWKQE
ncbi:putative DNA binding domain-containing protein [bacterium]|nr:putative DNA binding domain-containing protein [bacterium]